MRSTELKSTQIMRITQLNEHDLKRIWKCWQFFSEVICSGSL